MGTTSDSNTHTGHCYSDLDADPDTDIHYHVGCDAGTPHHADADLISMSGVTYEENDVVRCSVSTY
jgi:hypothetical protein